MNCPICNQPLLVDKVESKKAIYIAEDCGTSTEYYSDILPLICSNNHTIYIPPDYLKNIEQWQQ